MNLVFRASDLKEAPNSIKTTRISQLMHLY